MDIVPLKSRVLGQLLGESKKSGLLWTPRQESGVRQMLRVVAVGEDVVDVEIDDVVILPDQWSGATLTVLDDETNNRESYFVIDEEHLLARIRGYDAGE